MADAPEPWNALYAWVPQVALTGVWIALLTAVNLRDVSTANSPPATIGDAVTICCVSAAAFLLATVLLYYRIHPTVRYWYTGWKRIIFPLGVTLVLLAHAWCTKEAGNILDYWTDVLQNNCIRGAPRCE